jgi:echinoderm microtubule-associated protein-like 6
LSHAGLTSWLTVAVCRTITIVEANTNLTKVMRLVGHSSTIRSIDWSIDSLHIMSMDQAYEQIYFDVDKGRVSKDAHRDERWHTWTSVLGFPVMGIWPEFADGTDINAVDRSPDGEYTLTCDDSGQVCFVT